MAGIEWFIHKGESVAIPRLLGCSQRHLWAWGRVLLSKAALLPPAELTQPNPLFQGKDVSELSAHLMHSQYEGLLLPHPHALEKSLLPFHCPQ